MAPGRLKTLYFTRLRLRRVASSLAAFAGAISQSGSRKLIRDAPRKIQRRLDGNRIRLDKQIPEQWIKVRVHLRRFRARPSANACTIRTISRGMIFDATEITPSAPTDINASVSPSSPERIVNFAGSAARSWLTRSTLPPASLIATMFRHSLASRATVSTPISTPHRPGMLYKIIGSFVLAAIAL